MNHTTSLTSLAVAAALLTTAPATAQEAVSADELRVDRPTVNALGVQVLVSGDDDEDASAELFVREAGTTAWKAGLPMLRVLPDTVIGLDVPHQIAGSAFDLKPATAYEIEVRVSDPDGGDEVLTATATTRPVPVRDPATPRQVAVQTADELRTALQNAEPGDVITIAEGIYNGSFSLNDSGTAENPIVIRGAERDGVIFDGEDCGCNVFEIYGSYTHVESLTVRNAVRAMRFLGTGATGNVARDLRIEDVVHGIGSQADQLDFYLCDNIVHGRLEWPLISTDDGAQHNDDQGIRVDGDGHVICHNEISGFGDPILNFAEGYRAFDAYGNDVFDIYGDGIEIDRAAGNARVYRNRWTNVYTAISIQPVRGGPAYVFRNVIANVADEQVKLKSVGGDQEPSGALIFHNTFVSPEVALNLQTPITQHNFRVENNLFVGPDETTRGYTVDWTARVNRGNFDSNGYFPDGQFWFGRDAQGTNRIWGSFAEVQAAGVYEANGRLVEASPFASGFVPPNDYTVRLDRQDLTLSESSVAVDGASVIAGVNDGFKGAAPDLGALELGCAAPAFGPRQGTDEGDFEPLCAAVPTTPGDDVGPGGDPDGGPGSPGDPDASNPGGSDAGITGGSDGGSNGGSDGGGADGGCSCRSAPSRTASAFWLLLVGAIFAVRRGLRR